MPVSGDERASGVLVEVVKARGAVVTAHRFRPAAPPLPRNDLVEFQGRR